MSQAQNVESILKNIDPEVLHEMNNIAQACNGLWDATKLSLTAYQLWKSYMEMIFGDCDAGDFYQLVEKLETFAMEMIRKRNK